jgi:hypothetical protein
MKSMFSAGAPALKTLIDGVGGFVKSAMPGFTAAMQNAAPIIEEIGYDMSGLGTSIGGFVEEISSTPGLLKDVDEGFSVLEDTLSGTAAVVHGLGSAWNFAGNAVDTLTGQTQALTNTSKAGSATANDYGQWIDKSTASFELNKTSVAGLDARLKELISTQKTEVSQLQGQDDSLLAMDTALTANATQLKTGKKGWDEMTAAGQANVSALNTANKAITGYYDSLAAATPLTEKQTAAELKAEQSLYATEKAAGATKAELATLKAEITGTASALGLLKSKSITVTVHVNAAQLNSEYARLQRVGAYESQGGVVHAAQGLVSGVLSPKSPGTLVMAGEPQTHGEVFMPLAGISKKRAQDLMTIAGEPYGLGVTSNSSSSSAGMSAMGTAGFGGMGGRQNIVVELVAASGDQVAEALMALLRPRIRGQFGGNVTLALAGA